MNSITFRSITSVFLVLAVPSVTIAQSRPDAGQVQRDVQSPAVPQISTGSGVAPEVGAIQPAGTPAVAPLTSKQPRFAVQSVRITDSVAFTEVQLLALIPELAGGERTLADLQQAAARITRHYRQAGYMVARAYLPQQKLEGGAVTIAVLEGKLSDIKVQNSSRLMSGRAEAFLNRLERGQPVRRESVDRPVLLLGDVPGVGQVDSRLAAGAAVGDSVLNVRVSGDPAVNGRVELDNHGGLYTGRARLGASVNGNSLLGYGERFSARLLTSNSGLLSGRAGAQAPLGSDGLTINGGLNRTTYELGDVFEELDVKGRSDALDLGLRYPLLRSNDNNVYISLNGERRKLHDEVRSTETVTSKHAKVLNLSLNGDWRDSVWGGGVTLANLMVTSGKLRIDSADAAELDAVAANTVGSYRKWSWSLERQQVVARGVTFSFSARGQSASKNLDSSEKFSLGGANGVRAYPSGEASGDSGWLASLELRYAVLPQMAVSVFYDAGSVTVNTNPYLTTDNKKSLAGAGIGLSGEYEAFNWRTTLAWRNGDPSTAEPDKKPRFWVQAGWRF